jgi:hypothetical protein
MTFACFVSDKHEPVCGNSCTLGIASSHSSSLTIETKTIRGNIKVHNPPAVICCALNVILNGLSECIPGFFANRYPKQRRNWRPQSCSACRTTRQNTDRSWPIGVNEAKLIRSTKAKERLPDHYGSISKKNVSLQQMTPYALLAYLHQSFEPGVNLATSLLRNSATSVTSYYLRPTADSTNTRNAASSFMVGSRTQAIHR